MTNIDSGQANVLPLTGERTVPWVDHENYWFLEPGAVYDLQ